MPGTASGPLRRVARAAAVAALLVSGGCALAPPVAAPSWSLEAASRGRLQLVDEQVAAALDAGESAFWLVNRNDAALGLRLALVDGAVDSLDVQTFIWNGEVSSLYVARRIVAAADRGVRVRFLLDDVATDGLDGPLAALDMHPRIEVRIFNPWRFRSRALRLFEFFARFDTLNHRMHNKTMIADGHFAVIGGRNIGDHYFGLSENFVQNDLDIVMNGPIVDTAAEQFDDYWNSEWSYPIETVLRRRDVPTDYDATLAGIESALLADRERLNEFMPAEQRTREWLSSLSEGFNRGRSRLLVDSPRIDTTRPIQLYNEFKAWLAGAKHEVVISSPYFIPDRELVELLGGLADSGVRVAVLTNSLASNNHSTAHTGYRKWRREVLRAGVELYELRSDAEMIPFFVTPPVEHARIGLHSKMAVVDGRYSYVGSANVDPRSMIINTELGVIIDSPEFAGRLKRMFERDTLPGNAWHVTLTDDNWLVWTNADERVLRQPARNFAQRFVEFVLYLLPLKGQG